jgi:hypothetical protein
MPTAGYDAFAPFLLRTLIVRLHQQQETRMRPATECIHGRIARSESPIVGQRSDALYRVYFLERDLAFFLGRDLDL